MKPRVIRVHPSDFHELARRFRRGADTVAIAKAMGHTEAAVANALSDALRLNRMVAQSGPRLVPLLLPISEKPAVAAAGADVR